MAEPVHPVLGELRLPLVQSIATEETEVLIDHPVPGLDAAFLQGLHRGPTRVVVRGVLAGDGGRDGLDELRRAFLAGDPLPFVADALTATEVRDVVIEAFDVGEVAGKPGILGYSLTLGEYVEPPADEAEVDQVAAATAAEAQQESEEQVAGVASQLGTLEVRVDLGEGGDFSAIAVAVEGTDADGEPFSMVLDEHVDGLYVAQGVRAATYTVRVVPS